MQKTSPPTNKDYPFGKGQAHFILVVTCLLYLINYMDRQVFAVVQEPMRLALGMTDTEVGIIQTAFVAGMGLFSLPLAYVVDRWSRTKAIGAMALLWSAFTFLTGFGKNFVTLLIPRSLVGVGEAGFTSGGTPLITTAYPKRLRATVLGIFNIVVPLGSAVGMALGGFIAVKYNSWSAPFFFFTIPGVIVGIMAFFLKDYKTVPAMKDSNQKSESFISSALSLLKIPSLWRLYIGYIMLQVMFISILTWLPTYMIRAQDIKADMAGLLTGVVGLLGIVGAFLGGVLADKWQKTNPRARMLVPAIAMVTGAACMIAALVFNIQGIGYVLACLFGVFATIALPPLTAVTQDVTPLEKRGQAWGMNVLLANLLGAAWAPLLIGLLSDALGSGADGLKTALLISTSCGIIAGIFFLLSSRHYPQDSARISQLAVTNE